MDKRLEQIKEGAGLEESRINEELIEFLKKHSDKFTFAILIVAVLIVGNRWLHQYRIKAENRAWDAYSAAAAVGPESLVKVAEDYSSRPGLHIQALLDAADMYMDSIRIGLKVHVAMTVRQNPNLVMGDTLKPEDELTPEESKSLLEEADSLYKQAYEFASGKEGMEQRAVAALFGRAAVAEQKKDWEQARSFYKQVMELAEKDLPGEVEWAQMRLDTLDDLKKVTPPIVVEKPAANPPAAGEDNGAASLETLQGAVQRAIAEQKAAEQNKNDNNENKPADNPGNENKNTESSGSDAGSDNSGNGADGGNGGGSGGSGGDGGGGSP